jgi:hypothetical protein
MLFVFPRPALSIRALFLWVSDSESHSVFRISFLPFNRIFGAWHNQKRKTFASNAPSLSWRSLFIHRRFMFLSTLPQQAKATPQAA